MIYYGQIHIKCFNVPCSVSKILKLFIEDTEQGQLHQENLYLFIFTKRQTLHHHHREQEKYRILKVISYIQLCLLYLLDINPTENLLDSLKIRVVVEEGNNASVLMQLPEREWRKLPLELCNNSVESIEKHIGALILVEGDYTVHLHYSFRL